MVTWPSESKEVSVQANEIIERIKKNEYVGYDHITIKGNLDLGMLDLAKDDNGRYIIPALIRIDNSIIEGNVNFDNNLFENYISFKNTTFDGTAYFQGSSFNWDADFQDSNFNEDANFQGSSFNRDADFQDSNFNKNANFYGSNFNSSAYFFQSSFTGKVNFRDANFNGDANFYGSKFSQNADFWRTIFHLTTTFYSSMFNQSAYFGKSRFLGVTKFENSQFNKEVRFNDAIFKGTISFNDSRFKEDVIFENTTFNDKISLTRTKYDKLYINWNNIKDGLTYDNAAYMSLMKNFKDLGYIEDYDNAYFQYRKEHKGLPWDTVTGFEEVIIKGADYPLEYLYGFGVKPVRPIIFAILIIILFGFLFWWIKYIFPVKVASYSEVGTTHEVEEKISFIEALEFSSKIFLSGTKLFVDPPKYNIKSGKPNCLSNVSEKMFAIERIAGALLFVLFVIAVGNTLL